MVQTGQGIYRVAVIGCGRVAWMLEDDPLELRPCTHMGGWLGYAGHSGRVEVVAGADCDSARLVAFGTRYPSCALYHDYREMLDTVRPDIVSICAYATDRHRMVMDAVASGVKGIWCEKAFGTSMAEAREMKKACEENGVSLVVSHSRRWHPAYRKAKEMIDDGAIGTLQSITSLFSGSLIHTGTHAFDVLRWFLGEPVWVEGATSGLKGGNIWDLAEDCGGRAHIQFENGRYAAVHGESKRYFLFEFDIIGTQGRIRIGNNDLLEYYTPQKSTHYTGLKELYPERFPEFEDKNVWVEAARSLVALLDGKAHNPSPPEAGCGALELALAVHLSAAGGSTRVCLPIADTDIRVRSR